MIKLLLIILPIAALSFYCWHYGTLRSASVVLLLDIFMVACSAVSIKHYGISFMQFVRLSHDSSLLTFELIVIVVLSVSLLLQGMAVVHRWHRQRTG